MKLTSNAHRLLDHSHVYSLVRLHRLFMRLLHTALLRRALRFARSLAYELSSLWDDISVLSFSDNFDSFWCHLMNRAAEEKIFFKFSRDSQKIVVN